MRILAFKGIYTLANWIAPGFVKIGDDGKILAIEKNKPTEDLPIENISGYAIPGFQNAHSHAFQYAMAGVAESTGSNLNENFWTWRKQMYQIALSINPDQLEAIATGLYAEMLRNGFTDVAEFHYLHHDPSGKFYSNKAEMAHRLINAANNSGINITIVPIFYQKGGFGKAPQHEQRRFISHDFDQYLQLWESTEKILTNSPRAKIAAGIHSLRAVDEANIKATAQHFRSHPLHIHVSEQEKEVIACQSFLNQSPIQWIANEVGLNNRFHLVHATHISQTEIQHVIDAEANIVLCPSTEANLGDGLFPLKPYIEKNGKWCIGTDSHVGLNPLEELRWLDYGQRLTSKSRQSFPYENQSEIVDSSILNGYSSMGKQIKTGFQLGTSFDAVVIDASAPLIANSCLDNLLSTLIYTSDPAVYLGTQIGGKWKVRNNIHVQKEEINRNLKKALVELSIR